MTEPKGHTPLPWVVRDNGETIFIKAPDGSNLAQITFLTRSGRRPADEGAANARLICHAVNTYPQLVEALKSSQTALREYGMSNEYVARVEDEIRAAIKLAEGGGK
jgi:hypothetical protein